MTTPPRGRGDKRRRYGDGGRSRPGASKLFRPIRACAVETVLLLMVDAPHLETVSGHGQEGSPRRHLTQRVIGMALHLHKSTPAAAVDNVQRYNLPPLKSPITGSFSVTSV